MINMVPTTGIGAEGGIRHCPPEVKRPSVQEPDLYIEYKYFLDTGVIK